MDGWKRFVSAVGAGRIVVVLGWLYAALAVAIVVSLLRSNAAPAEVAGRGAVIALPAIVHLYGGRRLRELDLHPHVTPRVVAWTAGGIGIMVLIVAVIEFSSPSGLNDPFVAVPLAIVLGSTGGFGAGVYDAQAKTRRRQLEETIAQLRTSNERLEQFAYAASHDLQEPLRMVSSYLTLLENRYGDDLDDDAREFIEFAVDGADRMRAMIDSLLEYSRVSSGDEMAPTDVDAVVEDILDDLQLRIEETDATVTTDEFPTVIADRNQLAEVFRNLVSNALTYSGGEPPRVHVGVDRVDGAWRFSVRDEGIGIDPEYHDRIFDVFERLHTDTGTSEDGVGGIGLALCERIVERHGGEIWVDSESGAGATFYFTVPMPDDREPRRSTSTARARTRG